jgi:dTDP-4-dehydrorhamnose 3,5-epimerase
MINNNIPDCIVYKSKQIPDHRGFFSEIYNNKYLIEVKQINCSFSYRNVFRGIHQATFAKLVSCVSGSIIDFCVDLRPNSPTYLQHYAIELSSHNKYQLYIPSYCGHGFLALENSTIVYAQDDLYHESKELTHCYKQFNLDLPHEIILSDKDRC